MAILDQRLLILGRSKICLILFSGRNYVPFYYWSKICPLYLLVEKVSVDNMSVEKMSRCQSNSFASIIKMFILYFMKRSIFSVREHSQTIYLIFLIPKHRQRELYLVEEDEQYCSMENSWYNKRLSSCTGQLNESSKPIIHLLQLKCSLVLSIYIGKLG